MASVAPHGFRSTLLRTGLATLGAAAAGSLLTAPGSAWYRSREKPSWQPPGAAFPVVWTVLYTDIAVTSAAVLTRLEASTPSGAPSSGDPFGEAPDRTPHQARTQARGYWRALGANLVLNAGWTGLFFGLQRPSLGTVGAAALTLSSADLARRAWSVDRGYGAALVPYAAWCGFATALSAEIWRRNGDG